MSLSLNLTGKNPYIGLLSKFTQQFQQFIKDLGDAKSKSEEDRIVTREAAFLKEAIHKPGVSTKQQKEHLVRLIYCNMLGADVTFSHMEAVKFAQQQNLLEKRVAYSALCLFLDEHIDQHSECLMMNTGTVQRDLSSKNVLQVCFGLVAGAKLVTKDMLPGVLPLVQQLMKHGMEVVRKKAVLTMLKFFEMDTEMTDYLGTFQSVLCDKDPAVMGVTLNAFHKFVLGDPAPFRILVASFVSILKQIVDRKLPHEFNFKGVPAPWMQIKLLQILAVLGSEDSAMSKIMYEVLRDCLDNTDTEQGVGCAVVYECMKTIATVYPNRALIELAAGKAALFLKSDLYNLKYLGINALSDFINADMSYGARHQMDIIDCLTDHDESIKRKTLELLYRMTNGSNVKFICERLIVYLKSTVDEYARSDLVLRITTLAEKYAPDNEWFIEIMNEVFEIGGDLVPVKVAYNMMAIIGEGIGDEEDDCESMTHELRCYAVMSYASILDKPSIPDILVQLACWVLGEYYEVIQDYEAGDITGKLYQLLHRKFIDPLTQSWIVSAIMKIVCRTDAPRILLQDLGTSSLNHDARQRYLEMLKAIDVCTNLKQILPFDASCEDINVDSKLSFLDNFVANSIESGATIYAPDSCNRNQMNSDLDAESSRKLRFDKYEEPVYQRFQKAESVAPLWSKEKEKSVHLQDGVHNPVKTACSTPMKKLVWTKEGYSGSLKEGSSSSSSTPASSESGSVKTEEDALQKLAENDKNSCIIEECRIPSVKEELAKQLFTTAAVNNSQRFKKVSTPRKTKAPRELPDEGKSSMPLNLLDLKDDSDLLGHVSSSVVEAVSPNNVSLINALVPDNFEEGEEFNNLKKLDMSTSHQLNTTPGILNEVFDGMSMGKDEPLPPSVHVPISSENMVNALSSDIMLSPPNPASLMDAYDTNTLFTPSSPQESVDVMTSDAALYLPDHFKKYKYSPTPIAICMNQHIRLTCRYVYEPTQLTLVFFLCNQSLHSLSNIYFSTKLPSNLRSTASTLDFHRDELASMSWCIHTVSLTYASPALHMVLSGSVKYLDMTKTEKQLFIENHVLQMHTLLRPTELSVEEFGERWKDRSLKEKKAKPSVKLSTVLQWTMELTERNLQTVEVIGREIIFAGTLLNKDLVLVHVKLLPLSLCEISIKSGSTLLNDALMKFLLAVTSS